MNWFLIALKKYAVFQGRASRSEYWFFMLFYTIIMGLLLAAAIAFKGIWGFVFLAALVLLYLPHLGVTIRRLHDVNKSGWWYLIVFAPFGIIVLLIFLVKKSTPGNNY